MRGVEIIQCVDFIRAYIAIAQQEQDGQARIRIALAQRVAISKGVRSKRFANFYRVIFDFIRKQPVTDRAHLGNGQLFVGQPLAFVIPLKNGWAISVLGLSGTSTFTSGTWPLTVLRLPPLRLA